MTDSRERFEAWANSKVMNLIPPYTESRDWDYFSSNTQKAWEAWQERGRQFADTVANEVHAICTKNDWYAAKRILPTAIRDMGMTDERAE